MTSSSTGFPPRSIFVSRVMGIPRSVSKRRSTRMLAGNLVLISAVRSSGQYRLSSTAAFRREGDSRLAVDADLTQAKIDNLLPGWSKAPGEAARATFTLVNKSQATRFEDMVIEAPNASVKGMVEVDSSGEVVVCKFPGVQPCEPGQGDAQGRSRLRWNAAGDPARRRL